MSTFVLLTITGLGLGPMYLDRKSKSLNSQHWS
jgi:hypothetical protein